MKNLDDITKMVKEYEAFSLTLQNENDEEVNELFQQKNTLLQDIVDSVIEYIKCKANTPDVLAHKIWNYLTEHYCPQGLHECIANLDDLLELFV